MSTQNKNVTLVTTVDDNISGRYTFDGLYRNGVKTSATYNNGTVSFEYSHPIGKEESFEYKWVANNFSHSVTIVVQGLIAGPVALRFKTKWDEDLSSVSYQDSNVELTDGGASALLTTSDTDINKDLIFYVEPLAELSSSNASDVWGSDSDLTYQEINLQGAFIGIYQDSYNANSPSTNLISSTFPKNTTTALTINDLPAGKSNKIIIVFDPNAFVTKLNLKSNVAHTVAVNSTNYNLTAGVETAITLPNA